MHYYQFNIGDYHSHTNHLDPLEDLAYRRMLDWCYLNETNLPDDVDEIARLIRMRPHTDCITIVLRDFFTLTDEGYTQSRIQLEVNAYREKCAKAKKSAEARWNKKPAKTKGLGDANALQTQSEGNAKHKPLTNNHIINQKKEFIEKAWAYFWDKYPKRVDKKKARSKFELMLKNKSIETSGALINKIGFNIDRRLDTGAWLRDESHFIPSPAKYLLNELWNDEI